MIWIFWEMTSGIISVCSALGSTVDTCFCQSTRLWGVSHIFYVNVNSLSLSTETGFLSGNCAADREDLTGTILGLIVDAPVVVQRQVPWFRQYRIPWRFRSCSLVNTWPMSLLCFLTVVSSTRSSLSDGGFRRILRHFSRSSSFLELSARGQFSSPR